MRASSFFPGRRRALGFDEAILLSGGPAATIVVDPGHERSWPGTGQKVLDLTTGGYDFFLGADGTVAADDPTPRGNVGRRSSMEYLECDGGDFLQYDSANEAFMNNMHKANAKWSYAGWFYHQALGTALPLFNTCNNVATEIGAAVFLSSTFGTINFFVANGSGTSYILQSPGFAANAPGWNFVGFSYDQAADKTVYVMNELSTDRTPTLNGSPSAASSTATLRVGAFGASGTKAPAGTRYGPFAFWDGLALDRLQLSRIRAASKRIRL